MHPRRFLTLLALLTSAAFAGPAPTTRPAADVPDGKAQSLFDGKTLGKWKVTEFGGQGEVTVEDGNLIIQHGETLSGVTWQGPVPAKMNFEIELDAQRVDGNDFFCGLTFPVNNDCASLILGGWGGGVCGISSIDGNDAARNDTTTVREFKKAKWYHIKVRVTPDHIDAWVDDEQIVKAETKGHQIDVRSEVEASKPMGLATYQTTGAFKNIKFRKIEADEK
jgi:hypothetical protein